MRIQKLARMFFKIEWSDAVDDVECKTLATITLVVDGTPVWPVKGEDTCDFEWYADELLAHLAECWKPLVLRQNYPIPVQPERPSFLSAEAFKRWSELPDAPVESEEREVAAFEDVHNLANAFGGISGLLPLWLLRDEDKMIVDTQEFFVHVPLQDAINALTSAGDVIAARLKQADERKWVRLLAAWKRRHQGDPTQLLALTIGRDRKTAAALIAEKVIEAPTSFEEAANDNDELRIAARIAGAMPLHQIKSILEKVRTCTLRQTPKLREIAANAVTFIESGDLINARPHIQGNELAIWLRRTLGLSANRIVDPVQVLERHLNVDVRVIDFRIPSLDAIAVWGPKYGPAVLINQTSSRIGHPRNIWKRGALRVTAAHELCHLLLDSRHALSAVEVLGARMPARIEQRAGAFAAEFLLPSTEAAEVWKSGGFPLDLEGLWRTINRLCKTHNVTKSIAAWQIQHGASAANWEELDRLLDQLVPYR
jgi:Zn-dependent peptidase ImmA (M78 family)